MKGAKGVGRAQVEPNVTPLADVTMTLIIVFLIAMPALMWTGIRVNPATPSEAEARETVPVEDVKGTHLLIEVTPAGYAIDGEFVAFGDIEPAVFTFMSANPEGTVVVAPDDEVVLDAVVSVLDAAKGGGADKVALLDRGGANDGEAS
jgi:biopolymer transport protein ExbD